eukprot:m.244357 g.244357  ORF g.244357 m.244357 type:complete len:143 (-) comp14439_c0_seq1:78-506(-)
MTNCKPDNSEMTINKDDICLVHADCQKLSRNERLADERLDEILMFRGWIADEVEDEELLGVSSAASFVHSNRGVRAQASGGSSVSGFGPSPDADLVRVVEAQGVKLDQQQVKIDQLSHLVQLIAVKMGIQPPASDIVSQDVS